MSADIKIRTRGRPRKEEGKIDRSVRTRPVSVSLPGWFIGQLTVEARKQGVSLSELVRAYIIAGMEAKERK
jgi:hypothetical protein